MKRDTPKLECGICTIKKLSLPLELQNENGAMANAEEV